MRSETSVAKLKVRERFEDPTRGPLLSPRFVAALLLVAVGIAWIVYYYVAVRVDPTATPPPKAGDPAFMADLKDWNYAIGFGLIFLGLSVSAHPSTPLGRGRGVVVTMLACFLIGLVWICVYYVFRTGDNPVDLPVIADLDQYNLLVGIGFMAVGFAFATRWE